MSEMSCKGSPTSSASARISLVTDESHFSLASLNSSVSQDEFFRCREHSDLVLKRMQEYLQNEKLCDVVLIAGLDGKRSILGLDLEDLQTITAVSVTKSCPANSTGLPKAPHNPTAHRTVVLAVPILKEFHLSIQRKPANTYVPANAMFRFDAHQTACQRSDDVGYDRWCNFKCVHFERVSIVSS